MKSYKILFILLILSYNINSASALTKAYFDSLSYMFASDKKKQKIAEEHIKNAWKNDYIHKKIVKRKDDWQRYLYYYPVLKYKKKKETYHKFAYFDEKQEFYAGFVSEKNFSRLSLDSKTIWNKLIFHGYLDGHGRYMRKMIDTSLEDVKQNKYFIFSKNYVLALMEKDFPDFSTQLLEKIFNILKQNHYTQGKIKKDAPINEIRVPTYFEIKNIAFYTMQIDSFDLHKLNLYDKVTGTFMLWNNYSDHLVRRNKMATASQILKGILEDFNYNSTLLYRYLWINLQFYIKNRNAYELLELAKKLNKNTDWKNPIMVRRDMYQILILIRTLAKSLNLKRTLFSITISLMRMKSMMAIMQLLQVNLICLTLK